MPSPPHLVLPPRFIPLQGPAFGYKWLHGAQLKPGSVDPTQPEEQQPRLKPVPMHFARASHLFN